MVPDEANRREPSPEDAQRLNRLSEEVRGRLLEIALIMARVGGKDYDGGAVGKFVPRETTPLEAASGGWIEIVDFPDGTSGCYGELDGRPFVAIPCA